MSMIKWVSYFDTHYFELLENLGGFYDFGTENFAVVCEEYTIIGERTKTSNFSDESEVYEVVCSNQDTTQS